LNRWYPEALKEFKIITIFDLLFEYVNKGKIKLDNSIHTMATAYHDPCNYGRKSLKEFGQAYFDEGRAVTRACCHDVRELSPDRNGAYCCGAGGGVLSMPYSEERVFHGRIVARQIVESGAKLIIASCHTCRDQIMKSISYEYDLDIEVKYIWQLVADSLILPGKQ